MTRSIRLGDVSQIVARIVDPTLPEFRELPHISAENIVPLLGHVHGVQSAADDGMTSGKYQFECGDVLYSKLRPYLRKVTVADGCGLCSADMYPLKANENQITAAYLRALLVSDRFTAYAVEASARSRMPKLNREQLFRYEFNLPPIEEQRQTTAQLEAQLAEVDKARQAAEMARKEVEPLRTAVYREAFSDIIPVSLPLKLGDPPKGWDWYRLTDVARLESGHTPSRERADWWGGDVSWISLTEIRALDGQWVEGTQLRTNEQGIANSAARILPRGTVCYSRTASVGFVAIMARPMATSQDFANWVCSDALDPEFLMYALICARTELRKLATGATHKTIYMPTLKSLHVCAPNHKEQQIVVRALRERLGQLEILRSALIEQETELAALPQRLLGKAFEI
jgi:type I restriction enzyme, S subunit